MGETSGQAGIYRLATVLVACAALFLSALAYINTKETASVRTDAGPVVAAPADFTAAAEAVIPSLVRIENLALSSHPAIPQFGGGVEVPKRGGGAGFFIDDEGLVLTNYHVVEGAQVVNVITRDHGVYTAETVGSDALTDLAIVRIKPDFKVKPVSFGDSDRLKVGQWVLAMGNPLGLEFFTTAGIVSGFGPPGPGYMGIYDFIQMDVNIKPGNSGGPLVDVQGKVVGVNSAYLGPGSGIGFSIPVNRALDILATLKEKGRVARGFMGLIAQPVTPGLAERLGLTGTAGAVISAVMEKSPAYAAGLKEGDVVLGYDGSPVINDRSFYEMINTTAPHTKVSLDVVRDGKRITLSVAVGELGPRNVVSQRVITQCGITLRELDKQMAAKLGLKSGGGLLVLKVIPGCPSYEAGLAFGDIITKVEGVDVFTVGEFYREYSKMKPGSPVLIQVIRGGRPQFLTIKQLG